jgi:hypothetical protein
MSTIKSAKVARIIVMLWVLPKDCISVKTTTNL